MGIINTQAVADGRKVRTGKDGALYNGKGKLLATVEVFQAQMGVANQKYHPLGTPLEQEILDSIGTTLTFTECVVEHELWKVPCKPGRTWRVSRRIRKDQNRIRTGNMDPRSYIGRRSRSVRKRMGNGKRPENKRRTAGDGKE